MSIKTVEGNFKNVSGKYALLVSRWNSFVVEHLKEGAIDTLRRHGIDDKNIEIVYAPLALACLPWTRSNKPLSAQVRKPVIKVPRRHRQRLKWSR